GWAALNVNGITIAAIIACNAVGDVVDPHTGAILAGARKTYESLERINAVEAELDGLSTNGLHAGSNTTIGVIITDATLTKAQAQRLAQVGHDGLARTIRPVHTAMDGDTLFALATGKNPASVDVMQLATAAGEVTAMAIINAIKNATSLKLGKTWWPAANEGQTSTS
ncbi:MAG: peptidase S58 family protein, partial [Rhodocyclales bacterium]|nr:peptidase S58 family protein [Rhodocyclales bacterium]